MDVGPTAAGLQPDADESDAGVGERAAEDGGVPGQSSDGVEPGGRDGGELDLAPGFVRDAAVVWERHDRLGDRADALERGGDPGILEADGEPLALDPDQALARRRAGHEAVVGGDPAGLVGVEDGAR